MSTSELKLSITRLVKGTNDNSLLEAIYTLLSKATENQEADWYTSLSEEAKASIGRGIEDVNNGRAVPHEDAMKRISTKIDRLKNA